MNNFVVYRRRRAEFRLQLLSTVSAAVLASFVCGSGAEAARNDSDRPSVWIDLGWQFERVGGNAETFAPAFLTSTPRPDFEIVSPLSLENTLPYAYGAEGKISFEPQGTNWVFSAAIRYGRSHGRKTMHLQTASHYSGGVVPYAFADTMVANGDTHAIVDFQTGRDLGLGMFGRGGASQLNLGIRFAQFHVKSDINISENPRFYSSHRFRFHEFAASTLNDRNFSGIGPSIAWNASAALLGGPQDGEISADWGANAALLFGRQKANVQHQTHEYYAVRSHYYLVDQNIADRHRSKSVIVPNLGGFAGLSFRYSDARLSLGYRADFFFNAIDGGIDAAKKENRSFSGPYASVSIGIGD